MIYIIYILVLITTVYFCSIVWVIYGFIKIKGRDEVKLENKVANKISVIIPVRNEENNIRQCLESLKSQSYKTTDFEIVIVDDHSTDDTQNVINDFIITNEINCNIFSLTDKTSKKEALKYGIEKSCYDIIATTDADCVLPENWLQHISQQFNYEIDMLLGPIIYEEQKGLLYWFQLLDMLAIQGIEFGTINYRKPILNNAANLVYSKKTYHEENGFDVFNTPSGDDIFLLEKFKVKGKKIIGLLAHDFIVETEAEPTFSGFLNQRLRWSSKSKFYSDKLLIYFSSIVLIQNISLLFIYLGIPLVEKYSIILTILLFCKWLIDFILLFLVASFFKRKKALLYFIPVQVIYPFYIILIWIASMTMEFEWKGRKFNG